MKLFGVTLVAALLAACSAAATPSPSPTSLSTRIEIRLSDGLTMEPAQMTVPAGVPVTFVVVLAPLGRQGPAKFTPNFSWTRPGSGCTSRRITPCSPNAVTLSASSMAVDEMSFRFRTVIA